ncbi:MAG: pyridoxal phosphate-dependent aminotransferase [Phycisphaerales bacterium]|nr:pyridoxal phosphate-dependent aminotransferase [Phycisphaerae bacterium]NNF42613.1 pyridoxal phosphate-dependent aminotransferase [Phycisphaerales bacterium]NNM26101.1 pyridoxal phosphate-dependent aminotransferase [Phycisphaerales bacterium]
MTMLATNTAFRALPFMGVIRVNVEAMKHGFSMGHPDWVNLGQGQPEVGTLDGAPPRLDTLTIDPADHAYGAVEGVPELREAIAAHYNRLYRQGKASQYTAENVAVAAGGRLALSRCGAALETIRLGYFTPDYTAYEDLLTTFHRIRPTWIELTPEQGFRITPEALEKRVVEEGIDALLISNPCNPTGVVIQGPELAAWVDLARRRSCTLLMDEFYSHYVYSNDADGPGAPVSAAAFVEDVEADPVVIVDGLTKCYRYPGWRMGWVVAPTGVIRSLTAAGSFLDGGSCRPMQRAAIEVLEPGRSDQETNAVRDAFAAKQRTTLERLGGLGVEFPGNPRGTFYAFGSIRNLPAPFNDGERFMNEAFKHQVLTVPGEYFDVNPNRSRTSASPLAGFVRFSFGPSAADLDRGLTRLETMLGG